jgi:soluble epoxide hydrolase / lipid-phosphate phosphatase
LKILDYLDVAASTTERGLAVLVHGWPDISFAWRYQIPLLASLGFRCIALDCMGYGETGTSTRIEDFTFKAHADAIAAITKDLGYDKCILGGHDWGGMVVYRAAQFQPNLISHVFSVATPYMPVSNEYVSTEKLVQGPLPQFGYQLQLGSDDQKVERVVKDEATMRKFLTGIYGGKLSSKEQFMTPEKGVNLEALANEKDVIAMTPLLNEEVSV